MSRPNRQPLEASSIRYRAVSKYFGADEVLCDIDLDIDAGEFIVFVGPSGCGKSTLLRVTAGLEDVSSGRIYIGRQDATDEPPARRGLAMVFQSYALYPHLTVRQNIGFPLRMAGAAKRDIRERVETVAGMLDLGAYLERQPRELSGGQRQRVAIGRAIVREPRAFLFDEPLSNLDAALRVQMREELKQLHRRLGSTMIYVTHDQTEAMTMADRIVVLNGGRIEQVDTPLGLYREPASLFVAGFIGSPKMNILSGAAARRRGAAALGIRPEDLAVSRSAGEWPATTRFAERLGHETNIHADLEDGQSIVVRVAGDCAGEPGQRFFATPEPDRVHLFDADGRRLVASEPEERPAHVS